MSGKYIVLISVHGLIRGQNLELGRDRDTGGQTKYVIELAKALASREDIAKVDLFTILVKDDEVDLDYKEPFEKLSDKAQIVRFEYGTNRYLTKEKLWSRLDTFSENALAYLNKSTEKPDVIHSHYADAAEVGMNLAKHYPEARLVHTGHSLGRIKLLKLLEKGLDRDSIEEKYNISKRIMVEEAILEQAEFIVASSNNEIDEQYGMYDAYQKSKFKLIPPGVDTEIFNTNELNASYFNEINRFLDQPEKPIILSICRPDERKNISSLIIAYGRSPALQEKANLVLVLGSRQDIKTMPPGPNKVLTNVLLLIDKFNLYGKVAYPKQHQAEDIPNIYKYAASTKGVFVNPALTEPFGLTLLEAASCRLPIVATKNGGPNDIVKNCKNGILIDTLNIREMAEAIEKIVSDEELWESYSENGVKAIKEFYSWQHHCDEYLKLFEQQKSLQEI